MKKPFKCPVCEGRGLVDSNFYLQSEYSTSLGTIPCRSCDGIGIVWSDSDWRVISSENVDISLDDKNFGSEGG